MTFQQPWLLTLLAAPLLAVGAYVWATRRRGRAAHTYAPGNPPAVRWPTRDARAAALVAALTLAAVAAARPSFGTKTTAVPQRGVEVAVVLDVSRSMRTADVAPDRLELAQGAIDTLLGRLTGSRVALVLFAGAGLIRAPLTTDLEAVHRLLHSASADAVLVSQGSDLGAGIRSGVRALEGGRPGGQEPPPDARAVVLVSDGEDHGGSAVVAAREAYDRGVRVYVAGVGTEQGGLILERDPATGGVAPWVDPATGGTVVSRLDEGRLRDIAQAGGGRYVPLAETGIDPVADALSGLRAVRFEDASVRTPIERFQIFALGALALLALERALGAAGRPAGRPPKASSLVPALALAGLVLGMGCAADADDHNDSGNRYYAQERYREALLEYRRAQAADPANPVPSFNAGTALYQLGEYERAATDLRAAIASGEAALRARAWYNLGNIHVRLGRLLDARAAYREALLLDPDDAHAKFNLELVNRALLEQPTAEEPSAPGGVPGGESEGLDDGAEESGQPGDATGRGEAAPGVGEPGADADRALAEALAGIDQTFTLEEALRVLDLLRERQTQGAAGGGSGGTNGGPQY